MCVGAKKRKRMAYICQNCECRSAFIYKQRQTLFTSKKIKCNSRVEHKILKLSDSNKKLCHAAGKSSKHKTHLNENGKCNVRNHYFQAKIKLSVAEFTTLAIATTTTTNVCDLCAKHWLLGLRRFSQTSTRRSSEKRTQSR